MSVETHATVSAPGISQYEYPYPTKSQRTATDDEARELGAIEQAGLRQFDFTRLMAYGIEPGDATRFLEALKGGSPWEATALEMEATLSDQQSAFEVRGMSSKELAKGFLERRSALLRISQAMEVRNTDTKRSTYLAAAELYTQAKSLDQRYSRETISTPAGALHAWQITSSSPSPKGTVLVHGGVDGWSMDWDGLAAEISLEGFNILAIDGPGQGESRFVHETFLTDEWVEAYRPVIAHMQNMAPGLPLFAVGNSMAAGIVLQLQTQYEAFEGVCSNGPVTSMSSLFSSRTYGLKLASFCGDDANLAKAQSVFRTIDLKPDRVRQDSPVLLLQGTEDPMVAVDEGKRVLEWTGSSNKSFALFERGEHVLNRFPADKHTLIRAWLLSLS